MMQIGNQTRIFSLVEGARSRVNTIYMIVFFLGGAAGSAISTAAWARWQWNGVCAMGLLMLGSAGVCHAFGGRNERRRRSLQGRYWGTRGREADAEVSTD
jgi:predicted MFS family arabinose efflux permease